MLRARAAILGDFFNRRCFTSQQFKSATSSGLVNNRLGGVCIGGCIDVITACDVRYCIEDVFFSVQEIDLAIVADLGTLQRLLSIVGYANAMELALTVRRFIGVEANALRWNCLKVSSCCYWHKSRGYIMLQLGTLPCLYLLI